MRACPAASLPPPFTLFGGVCALMPGGTAVDHGAELARQVQNSDVLPAGQIDPQVHVQGVCHHTLGNGRGHADHDVADVLRFKGLQKPDERALFSNNAHRSCGVAARPRACTDFSAALRPRTFSSRASIRAARTGSGSRCFAAFRIRHPGTLPVAPHEVTRLVKLRRFPAGTCCPPCPMLAAANPPV